MKHNGFKTCRKGHLGEANIGRYKCGACGKSVEEDRTFWSNLKTGFFDILTEICLRLRLNHASYELIEEKGDCPDSQHQIKYVVRDASKCEVDNERDASEFEAGYLRQVAGKGAV
jgi:hypothetical protein